MENLYSMNQHDTEAFVPKDNYEPFLNEPALPYITDGLTKAQVSHLAAKCVANVLEAGNVLQVVEGLSAMEQFIKEVKGSEPFKAYALEEIAKYGKGGYTATSGAKVEQVEGGTKYDYSQCNDPYLSLLEGQLADLQEKIKERQTLLKATPPEGVDIRYNDELVTVYPPSKTSATTYKVTLAKT